MLGEQYTVGEPRNVRHGTDRPHAPLDIPIIVGALNICMKL